MPAYTHNQLLKQAENLRNAEKIGACITCRYWDVSAQRTRAHIDRLARCMQPDLKPAQLIVSGGSACNKWSKKNGVPATVTDYAHEHESESE